jgi:hypothetical protein
MKTPPSRTLAVEIRAGRLGYAAFEAPKQMLDCGAAWFNSPAVARLRVAKLLRIFRPSVVVLRTVSPRAPHQNAFRRPIARIACSEATKLSIRVSKMTGRALKAYFESNSCRNKHDLAVLLATWFPEIAWRLPQRRKFYEPEARSMLYFDAAALGAAFMGFPGENNKKQMHSGRVLSPASRWRS